MSQSQFHRAMQRLKTPLFLRRLDDTDEFTRVAAEQAKEQRPTAFEAHRVDTTSAHDFAAMRAFIRDLEVRVTRAQHDATREHHRRFRALVLILRDGDGDVGVFEEQFHLTQLYRLARTQPGVLDSLAVDECAVGRVAIVNQHAVVGQHQFAVQRRHAGVGDGKITIRIAANVIDAETKFERLVFQTVRFDEQSGHGTSELFDLKTPCTFGKQMSSRKCGDARLGAKI